MSEILRRLNQRNAEVEAEVEDKFVERRDFCVSDMNRLARAAVDTMVENDFKSATIEHKELQLRDGPHAAWELAYWPQEDLPYEVERYAVLLLDTSHVVAHTKYWSGRQTIEPYNPQKYELLALNAISIYYMMADLPGVPSFKKESLDRMPK